MRYEDVKVGNKVRINDKGTYIEHDARYGMNTNEVYEVLTCHPDIKSLVLLNPYSKSKKAHAFFSIKFIENVYTKENDPEYFL